MKKTKQRRAASAHRRAPKVIPSNPFTALIICDDPVRARERACETLRRLDHERRMPGQPLTPDVEYPRTPGQIKAGCSAAPHMTYIPEDQWPKIGGNWQYNPNQDNIVFDLDNITDYEQRIVVQQLSCTFGPAVIAITTDPAHPLSESFAVIEGQNEDVEPPACPMPKDGRTKEAPAEALIDTSTFAKMCGKSRSWIEKMKDEDPEFPTPYVEGEPGQSHLYHPTQVREYLLSMKDRRDALAPDLV